MSLITLKYDSSPWANRFTQGNRSNHSAGFAAGNLLQLVFRTTPPPPPTDPALPPPAVPPYSLPEHSAFAFAIYLTAVSHHGRVGEESSSAFSDRSPAYVKELSGIVLPILLRYHLFSSATTQGALLGHLKLHHMMAPDASTLLEIPQLPPLLVFRKNYFIAFLPHTNNPRLANQGRIPRSTLSPRQNFPIACQLIPHPSTTCPISSRPTCEPLSPTSRLKTPPV